MKLLVRLRGAASLFARAASPGFGESVSASRPQRPKHRFPKDQQTSPLASLLCLLLGVLALWPNPAAAQLSAPIVTKVQIKHIGPTTVSDEFIRGNIRIKPGDPYLPPAMDDDVHNLYATGFFYDIRVTREDDPAGGGVILTYVVQEKPRLMEIKFQGNTKYSNKKLSKKLTSKTGEPLDERKLFTDSQEIQQTYQKAGYPRTEVKYSITIEQEAGRASATFTITEAPKMKIVEVDFIGAQAFTQKKLRKVIKTRKHWWLSWLTRSGVLKDDVFEEDKDRLADFYRNAGYIDFEIKDVQFINPTPRTMIIRIIIFEGSQYRVGSVKFTGNKIFSNADIAAGIRGLHALEHRKEKLGPNGLSMDVGDIFTPKGFTADMEDVQDFYGSKGYIDVTTSSRNLTVSRIPNTERGTMDLEFQLDEGQKYKIEKIEIRGNTKTKDKVIRRELAVSPGETFDMVRVKISKERLEGLQYFEPGRVDARPENTEPPIAGYKDLVVGVEEKNTGTFTVGAAFSSVDQIVGFAEIAQGNFDLFHPPTFTGGGQKFRLRVQIGTVRQDYVATFVEPWVLGRKLALSVEAFHHEASFQSENDLYDESRTGLSLGLERALGSDFLRGSIGYTLEDVGIDLTSGNHGPLYTSKPGPGSPFGDPGSPGGGTATEIPANVPDAILQETGHHLLNRFRTSLAYDTRNSVRLPNKGQRTEIGAEAVVGDRHFYKLNLSSAWYFRGFGSGDVLELAGRTGVADGIGTGYVPFYDKYYLGGLNTLRGFKYRSVSPRQPGFSEPIGGDTYWFGYAEYSIPIYEASRDKGGVGIRFAMFYDIGNVESDSYDWTSGHFSDDWGIGLRLNLPIGPLRLDYAFPLHHDSFNSSNGRFQFGVGYTREFQ